MSLDTFDGLHLCINCQVSYTTGELCTICKAQFDIDRSEGFTGTITEWAHWDMDYCEHDWVRTEIDGEDCFQCSICGLIDW